MTDNLKALYGFSLIKAKTEAIRENHRKKDVASDYQINAKSSGEESFVVKKCQSVRNVDFFPPETISKRCKVKRRKLGLSPYNKLFWVFPDAF